MSHWKFFSTPFFSILILWSVSNGREFGLMVDDGEFCLRPGESGGRVNVDSVLAECFSQLLRRHEQKSSTNPGTMLPCTPHN